MQISKFLLVVCTAIGCASLTSFAGPDSISQAQAREALRQKIAELNAQEATVETPAAPQSPKAEKKAAPAPAPKPQPATQPVPKAMPAPAAAAVQNSSPAPAAVSRATADQLAQQREALRKKIAELNAQEQPGQTTPAPAKSAPVVKSPETKPTDAAKAQHAAEPKRLAEEAKAREEAQKRAAAEAKAREKSKAKSQVSTATPPPAFKPADVPPPAVPASKEAKLNDLLSRYKADAITPEEYHRERAKILAKP